MWSCVVLCNVVWSCVVLCGVVLLCVVLCGVVQCSTAWGGEGQYNADVYSVL